MNTSDRYVIYRINPHIYAYRDCYWYPNIILYGKSIVSFMICNTSTAWQYKTDGYLDVSDLTI